MAMALSNLIQDFLALDEFNNLVHLVLEVVVKTFDAFDNVLVVECLQNFELFLMSLNFLLVI